jgi:carboxylesterase type B
MFPLVLSLAGLSAAQLFVGGSSPIVDTGYARYQGRKDALTKTDNYLGIKYAHAPRFDHAQLFNDKLEGVQQATQYGDVCPQHQLAPSEVSPGLGKVGEAISYVNTLPFAQAATKQSEDCLSINVQRPQDQSLTDLPVVVWIHGGGFEVGASGALGIDGTVSCVLDRDVFIKH